MSLEAHLLDRGKTILVKALLRNRFAMARMEEIAKGFPKMLRLPSVNSLSLEEDLADIGVDKAEFNKYVLKLRNLADDYNLKCDWIIGRLHHQIKLLIDPNLPDISVIGWATRVIDHFKLDVPIKPETRKGDVLQQVEKEWKRIKANPKFRQRQKPPANFDLSVEWLGLRLIYGYTTKRIEREGKDLKSIGHLYPPNISYSESDIIRGIRKATRFLEIGLPRGRPRKAKKK